MTPHISPGQDCTINPIVIDDSKRSAKNALEINEERQIIDAVKKHCCDIRKYSIGMKYAPDLEILNKCMPMIISVFKAGSERKQQPSYFPDVGEHP